MWPYFAVYALIVITTIPTFRLSLSIFVYTVLFVFLAFKGIVGCDYIGYYYHYIYFNPEETIIKLRGEVGWWYIEYLVNYFKLSYQWYYIVSGTIGTCLLFFAQKETKSLGFLVIIYPIIIIQLGLSGIRQFIAVCVVIYIIAKYLFNPPKSIFPFIFAILAAATFHISSLAIFLLLPFLKKLNTFTLITLTLIATLGVLSNFTEAVYANYETAYLYEGARGSNGAVIRFSLTILVLILGAYSSNYNYLRIAVLIFVLGAVIGSINSIALHRMNYYFYPIAGLLLIRYFRDDFENRYILVSAYILSIAYMIFWFSFSTHSHCLIPYEFFFNSSEDYPMI